jgi:polysaccharide biosynthesis protein PslH
MKILTLMIGFPFPPTSGGQLRDYNLLKCLSKNHEIHLLILTDTIGIAENSLEEIHRICKLVKIIPHKYKHSLLLFVKSLTMKIPYKVLQYTSLPFQIEISQMLHKYKFDIVLCDHIYLTNNLPKTVDIPVIPHTEDAFYFLYKQVAEKAKFFRRIYATLQWKILYNYEIKTYKKFGIFIAISEEEKERIAKVLPDIKIPIIPNGIDSNYYEPIEIEDNDEISLVYLGLMDSFPNEDAVIFFAREILPLLSNIGITLKIYIVGKNPTKRVLELGNDKRIIVTGMVDDVRPYIAAATIFIVPLRFGTGTRLKILEAMAMKVPVISTSIGCEGLNTKHDKNILIADTPKDFAQNIVKLLNDKNFRNKIAEGGLKLAEQYDWKGIGQKLDNFLLTLLKK